MLLQSSLLLALVAAVMAAPAKLGVVFNKRSGMPQLSLPYGTWQAKSYNPLSDIYTFKNIRYGAPPVGDLRWQKPATPAHNATLQDGSYGPICIQGAASGLNVLGPGNQFPIGTAFDQFLGGIPIPLFSGGSEDCLFLDVYVPGKAIRNPSAALPVIFWIFGGAYVFGSKDGFEPLLPWYDGSGLVHQSGNEVIFVSINYRVGAFGWLAGTTIENEGLPNAGLWDQRAAMQWVQDYISLLGGDPNRVTAMGESAGAGSILHHLVATEKPLFSKAIMQSPAYVYNWDRKGEQEAVFQNFSSLAGCAGGSMACLRSVSSGTLVNAATALNKAGAMLGPAADGSFIRQLAILELASGNFHPMESLLITHVSDESVLFVDGHIANDAEFNSFIDASFPAYAKAAGINTILEAFYPPVSTNKTYATEAARVEAFIREGSFTCNTRQLTEAYGDANVYNMQYSVTPGWHATDLLPTFYNSLISLDNIAVNLIFNLVPLFKGISWAYQSYMTSFALTGNPNSHRAILNIPSAIQWNHPDSNREEMGNVLNVGDLGFSYIQDTQNLKSRCDFWTEIAAAVTSLGGYAPPESVVRQNLVPVMNDVSANYEH